MLSWDLEKERNVKVWAGTLSTRVTKRGDWLKSWLMLHDYSALNTMFRKDTSETDDLRFTKRNRKTN